MQTILFTDATLFLTHNLHSFRPKPLKTRPKQTRVVLIPRGSFWKSALPAAFAFLQSVEITRVDAYKTRCNAAAGIFAVTPIFPSPLVTDIQRPETCSAPLSHRRAADSSTSNERGGARGEGHQGVLHSVRSLPTH